MSPLRLGTFKTRAAKIGREVVKEISSHDYSFNLLMGFVIGIVGGYGAVGFRLAIAAVQRFSFGVIEPGVELLLELPWYFRFFIPIIGGLIVGPIVTYLASEAKGHGVPEVMAAVATRGGIIRGRVAAAKVVASAVTIGSGGSAGSEGPIVQIGSSIASALGRLLRVSARRMKTFVGCGAAAGIAATFNAPVAGMLFALEVILGDFGVAQLSPIILASVVATAVSRMYLGDAPAFAVPAYDLASMTELVHYAVLGAAAGVIAVAFTKTLDRSENFFEKLRVPDMLKPAIGGLVIGIIGIAGLPHIYGVGYEFIEEALAGHLPLKLLLILLVLKMVATSATLGSGGSGGILAPSLFLGAMLGGVIWYGAQYISPDLVTSNYGAYSLVGMAAVVAATTRAPLQAILILFELTGGYEVILPLMLSSIIAVLVGNKLMEDSIYTVKLRARGIKLRGGAEINVLRGIKVNDVMRSDITTVPYNMRLRPLLDIVANSSSHHSTIFVLDKDNKLKGYISFHEIRAVLFDIEALEPVLVANDIVNLERSSVTPNDTLDVVMRLFARRNLDELPVVDPEDPSAPIGAVHHADVVDAYNNEILKRDLMGSMASSYTAAQRTGSTSLAPGYAMAEVEVPSHFVGKDLLTLDLRNREGIEVIMVRRASEDRPGKLKSIMPAADLVLQQGDVLLVSGPHEVMEKMARG